MRLIKAMLFTITFTVILLTIIPLTMILLVYSPKEEPPEAFDYILSEEAISIEEYVQGFEFGNLSDMKIREMEVNQFISAYKEMAQEELEQVEINYAYVDFMTEELNLVTHVTIESLLDFPVRIQVLLKPEFNEGVMHVDLERIRLGKLRVPNWVTRWVLDVNGVESPYLDVSNLSATYNIRENNPYSDFVRVKEIYLDETYLHINFGLNEIIQEGIVDPAVEVISEAIDEIAPVIQGEEKETLEAIRAFINRNIGKKAEEIDIRELEEMMTLFSELSPEIQDTLADEIQKNVDPEVILYMEQIFGQQMRK